MTPVFVPVADATDSLEALAEHCYVKCREQRCLGNEVSHHRS